jgi:hypothetical protein
MIRIYRMESAFNINSEPMAHSVWSVLSNNAATRLEISSARVQQVRHSESARGLPQSKTLCDQRTLQNSARFWTAAVLCRFGLYGYLFN